LWWISLLAAIAALYSAITLWQWGHPSVRLSNAVTYTTVHVHLGLFYYMAIGSMAVAALLLLVAAPSLKPLKKSGWNQAYYALLAQALTAVLLLFANGGGLIDSLSAAVVTIIGVYLLFEVRGSFIAAPAYHEAVGRKPYGAVAEDDDPNAADDEEPKRDPKKRLAR
jgi:hypothetical protein